MKDRLVGDRYQVLDVREAVAPRRDPSLVDDADGDAGDLLPLHLGAHELIYGRELSASTQRALSVQVMSKYMRNNDLALVNDLYDLYVIQNIPRIPRPSPEAVKTVLDQLAETDPRAANLKAGTIHRRTFFSGSGEGRVHPKIVEVMMAT